MKKIISIFISVCMVFTLFLPVNAAENTEKTENSCINILKDLNIASIPAKNSLTRAEFTDIAINAIFLDYIADTEISPYWDVDEKTTGYESICYAYGRGYLSPSYEGFKPDETVKYAEAVKILTEIAGYGESAELTGGFPTGYIIQAKNAGIIKGIASTAEALDGETAARLIWNTLNADIREIESIKNESVSLKTEKGNTLLYNTYGILKGEGVVTAVGGSSLIQEGKVSKKCIAVDDISYRTDMFFIDLLGYNVEFYYNEDEEKILAAYEKNNNVTRISPEDFSEIGGNKITILNNDRKKYLTKDNATALVYNGSSKQKFDKEIFDFENGEIICIDNNDDSVLDCIIVNKYEDYYAGAINKEKQTITDKNGKDKTVNFKDADVVILTDTKGKAVSFESISENNVVSLCVSEDGKSIRGVVSKECISGEITALGSSGEHDTAEISGEKYPISDAMKDSGVLELGKKGTFYLNAFGKISAYSMDLTSKDYAVLVKAALASGAKDGLQIKMYTGMGELGIFDTAASFTLDGKKYKSISKIPGSLAKPGLIRYKLNSNGEITFIDTPGKGPSEEDYSLNTVKENHQSQFFYGHIFRDGPEVSSDAVVFTVPDLSRDNLDEKEFDVGSRSILSNKLSYKVNAYTLGTDHFTPDVVVAQNPSDAALIDTSPFAVVKKVQKVIGDDGEIAYEVTLVNGGGEKRCYTDIEVWETYDVQLGDIIQYTTDYKDYISGYEIAFSVETRKMTDEKYSKIWYDQSRLAAGDVYYFEKGNVIGVTRGNVPAAEVSIGNVEPFAITESTICVVDSDYAKTSDRYIRNGKYSDIKDYMHNAKCSKAVIHSSYASISMVVLYQ